MEQSEEIIKKREEKIKEKILNIFQDKNNLILAGILILAFIILLGNSILIEAGISMVGLGQQNWLTLGLLLDNAVRYGAILPRRMYALWVPPGLALILVYLSFFIIQASMTRTFEQRKV